MVEIRTGQAPVPLRRQAFAERDRARFVDPAFAAEKAAIARLEGIARQADGEGSNAPLTRLADLRDLRPRHLGVRPQHPSPQGLRVERDAALPLAFHRSAGHFKTLGRPIGAHMDGVPTVVRMAEPG